MRMEDASLQKRWDMLFLVEQQLARSRAIVVHNRNQSLKPSTVI
jgi:hypothetical protein